MAGPSTDAKAIVCAHLTQAYVAANTPRLRANKDDVLSIYNEFVGMLEEQCASPPPGGYDIDKLVG